MAKKIIVTGKPARRIEVSGKPARRIEPAEFAAALGAEPVGEAHVPDLDPVSLAVLGSELVRRLRSSGGRPALTDASEFCRVPLGSDDIAALEEVSGKIERETGTRPSLGQLASVMIRAQLEALKNAGRISSAGKPTELTCEPILSVALVKKLVEEQLRPVKEALRRLANNRAG